MKRAARIVESIVSIAGHFSGWLVLLMMLLILFEVFMRYVVHRPPTIADEFSGYMLVAISFLSSAYVWKERGHVRVTALVERLPRRAASWLRVTGLGISLGFVLLLCLSSYGYISSSFKLHLHSGTLYHVPLQGPQILVAIGFLLLLFLLAVEFGKAIVRMRAGKNAEELS